MQSDPNSIMVSFSSASNQHFFVSTVMLIGVETMMMELPPQPTLFTWIVMPFLRNLANRRLSHDHL